MAVVEVVKYNGGPNVFAWKYPSEELGTWTQVIVNESQEAVLFKGGNALDVLKGGRHTLDTANIPGLSKLINLPFGGRSPFTAEIWYVNRLFKLDIKWGTASPIQIQDPKYGVFIPVRSNGLFGIRIKDSKKFLVKLVGTMSSFDEQSVIRYFRGLYITKAKDAISTYVVKNRISLLEINMYIDELSLSLKEQMKPQMEEYGIELVNFYVNDISIPEDDSAVVKLKNALAKKAEMDIIGYNYQQERSFDTMESAAKNESAGAAPFMGAGMGLGMGVGVGGAMAGSMSNVASQMVLDNKKNDFMECPKCHFKVPSEQKFCGSCGYSVSKPVQEEKSKAEKLKILCTSCGSEVRGTKFCVECGKKYIPCPDCKADMDEGEIACKVCGYEKPETCPNCDCSLSKETKFCPECGSSVAKACPKCNVKITGNPKFCPECGEGLR